MSVVSCRYIGSVLVRASKTQEEINVSFLFFFRPICTKKKKEQDDTLS